MRTIKLYIALFSFLTVFLTGCKEDSNSTNKQPDKQVSESLLKANRYLVKQEKEDIDNYIRRHGWEMLETGSGLQYFIEEKGSGEQVVAGKVITLKYTTRLITGDLIYSSNESGPKTFVVGHGGVESGLEEAVLLLHAGDKARIIIPSHLAYGLVGDDNKIPARATLIYEIELIELK